MLKEQMIIFDCPDCKLRNAELAKSILKLPEEAFSRRTHLFHGRYENLYINANELPGLEAVLEKGLNKAAEILGKTKQEVKLGFWLNIMNQGDVTTLHRHDDDDELLSAVYYVQAEEKSALFRLHHGTDIEEVVPVAGRFMFFNPALPHEVLVHHSASPRISIGINFGPVDTDAN